MTVNLVQLGACWAEVQGEAAALTAVSVDLNRRVQEAQERLRREYERAQGQSAAAARRIYLEMKSEQFAHEMPSLPRFTFDQIFRRVVVGIISLFRAVEPEENPLVRAWREDQCAASFFRVFPTSVSLGEREMRRVLELPRELPYERSGEVDPGQWQVESLQREIAAARVRLSQMKWDDVRRWERDFLEREKVVAQRQLEQWRAEVSVEVPPQEIVIELGQPAEGALVRIERIPSPFQESRPPTRGVVQFAVETLNQQLDVEARILQQENDVRALRKQLEDLDERIQRVRAYAEERIDSAVRLERLHAELRTAEEKFLESQQRSVWSVIAWFHRFDPGCPEVNAATIEQDPLWCETKRIRAQIDEERDLLAQLQSDRSVPPGPRYEVRPQDCIRATWARVCNTSSATARLNPANNPAWIRRLRELGMELLVFLPLIEALKKIGNVDLVVERSMKEAMLALAGRGVDAVLAQIIPALSENIVRYNVSAGDRLTLYCHGVGGENLFGLRITSRGIPPQ